jgi:Chaperone of endosialidase
VAVGQGALGNNKSNNNAAVGYKALFNNTTSGNSSQAFGFQALFSQTDGLFNNGFGGNALYDNVHGDNNTAMGDGAGFQITGSGNIDIGAGAGGFAGEDGVTRIGEDGVSGFNACFINGIYSSFENGRAVYVGSNGHLGTLMSSRRYKEDIKPMAEASETLFALKPVTFRYKKELNPSDALSFGLIAEDVAQVSADLVSRDKEGKPQTVRYEAVNAMLLNEFLKEHRKVEQLEASVAQQHEGMETLATQLKEQAAQIQKVSAEVAASKSAPQVVNNP